MFRLFSFLLFNLIRYIELSTLRTLNYKCLRRDAKPQRQKKTESLALIRWRCCQEWKCVHIKANQHAKSICQHSKSVHRNFVNTSVTTHCSRLHENIICFLFLWISIGIAVLDWINCQHSVPVCHMCWCHWTVPSTCTVHFVFILRRTTNVTHVRARHRCISMNFKLSLKIETHSSCDSIHFFYGRLENRLLFFHEYEWTRHKQQKNKQKISKQ